MIQLDSFHIDFLKIEDAKNLSEMMIFNTDRFKRYFPITLSKNQSLEDSKNYILEKNKEGQNKSEFTFSIKELISNKIVGLVIIKKIDWKRKQGEFAYCIDKNVENKGWMSKAIKATSKYAFETIGLKKLQIIVHKSNLGSSKVAKNADFVWQRTLLNEYTPPNESVLDMELYELNDER
jgi:ribosomal-protein-alanine N-acetyltransferase